jgi:ketosteroid isomerase-like protein
MSHDSNRDVIEHYVGALAAQDYDAMWPLLHDDVVFDWPQSRERVRGKANVQAIDANYPGGLPSTRARRVLGSEDRWVIDPTFSPRRILGAGDIWTVEAEFRYPDGTDWAYCSVVELREGRAFHITEYWAPRSQAPEWRAHWVETLPEE